MRALGLLGFVVVIAVIVWLMSTVFLPHTQQVLRTKQKVEPQVKQMAGKDEHGLDARDSITLKGDSPAGRLKAVTVTEIAAEGAMAKYFGLEKGDVIIEIAPQGGALMPISDMTSTSEAKDLLLTSYQNSQHVVVMRNGRKLTLPAERRAGSAPADASAKPLDGVIKIPTH